MTNKYLHLERGTWEIADGAPHQRLKRIALDVYIQHARIAPISRYMDYLYDLPKKIRMPCLLISAPSGMGKTTLLDKFASRHPAAKDSAARHERPVIVTSVPAAPELKHVQATLLETLGAPRPREQPWMTRMEVIRRLLGEFKTRVVVFDELQHISSVNKRYQTNILHWIKSLSTDLRIVVIGAGVSGIEISIQGDPQLSSRFRTMQIARWTAGPELAEFLTAYESVCPLRKPSGLAAPPSMRALVKCSDGITDIMMQCLSTLARAAVNDGSERIEIENIERWRDYQ